MFNINNFGYNKKLVNNIRLDLSFKQRVKSEVVFVFTINFKLIY